MGVQHCQGCSEKGICGHKESCALLEEEDAHGSNQVETQVTKLFPMYACLLIVLGPGPGFASSLRQARPAALEGGNLAGTGGYRQDLGQ